VDKLILIVSNGRPWTSTDAEAGIPPLSLVSTANEESKANEAGSVNIERAACSRGRTGSQIPRYRMRCFKETVARRQINESTPPK
jgi:hypothetical protein